MIWKCGILGCLKTNFKKYQTRMVDFKLEIRSLLLFRKKRKLELWNYFIIHSYEKFRKLTIHIIILLIHSNHHFYDINISVNFSALGSWNCMGLDILLDSTLMLHCADDSTTELENIVDFTSFHWRLRHIFWTKNTLAHFCLCSHSVFCP